MGIFIRVPESSVSSLYTLNCTKLKWLYLVGIWTTVHHSCKWLNNLVCYWMLWNLCDLLTAVLLSQVGATYKWSSTLSIAIHFEMQCFRGRKYLSYFQRLGQLSEYCDESQAWHPGFCSQQGQHIFVHFTASTPTLLLTQPLTKYTMCGSGFTP